MAGPHYDVTVEVEGRRYKGSWTLKQGGLICVCLPLAGAKTVPIEKARPEEKAVSVLKLLVKAHHAQMARERRVVDAKPRRLSRRGASPNPGP